MKPLRIRIVGGSLAGLFAGILLQKAGHDVKIYERSISGLGGRGAGLVGQHDLLHTLRLIGCEHVARIGVVAKERIYLHRDGSIAEKINVPQTQISWDFLHNTVASHIAGGSYVLGRQAVTVVDTNTGAEIKFADGTRESGDLVIGADGLGSAIRAAVNPHHHDNTFAGYVAWRGLIPETMLPEGAAMLSERFTFYIVHGVHVLGYLVPGSEGETTKGHRRYNWVWYRKVADNDLVATFTNHKGAISPFTLSRGGLSHERREALRVDADRMLPPQFALAVAAEASPSIQGIFDYEAPRMIGKSIALIGDAAFVVRPHTAMGVSKAAGDVMSLVACLSTEKDIQTALQRYEADRIFVCREIAAYGRQLGETAL